MNIFKKINIFWILSFVLSCFFAVAAYKVLFRYNTIRLSVLYQAIFNDLLFYAIIVPIFVGNIIKLIDDDMSYSKMISYGSRANWQKKVMKKLFIASLIYIFILVTPINVERLILWMKNSQLQDYCYCILAFITYVLIFTLISYIAFILKIQWNMDILVLACIIGIIFAPYLLTRIILKTEIINFSYIINAYFLFVDNQYLWFAHELMCIVIIAVIICVYALASFQIKNKDLLWRNDEK